MLQTWNRYAYVANNPLNRVDPFGLFCGPGSVADPNSESGCSPAPSGCGDSAGLPAWTCLAFEGWPGWGTGQSFWCMMMGGCPGGSGGSSGGGGSGGNTTSAPPPSPPVDTGRPALTLHSSTCPLWVPSGDYTLGSNANPWFTSDMSAVLSTAFLNLNQQGISPMITSGFRTAADQLRMRQGAAGPNPAAVISWHQVGQAVDFNTMGGNFDSIQNEMINQGLTWGGNFRTPDPVHFQLPAAGQRPTSTMLDACGG